MEANVSPTIKDSDLRDGFERYNEMQTGLTVTYDDLSFIELKMVTLIESVKNEVEQNKIEEVEKDAGRP